MTITTGMHPAQAAAKCDLVYDAEDDLSFPVKCFMRIDAEYDAPDRSVGNFYGGWLCTATLVGCQIGNLVLGEDDARAALDGNVAFLERVAGEWDANQRDAA